MLQNNVIRREEGQLGSVAGEGTVADQVMRVGNVAQQVRDERERHRQGLLESVRAEVRKGFAEQLRSNIGIVREDIGAFVAELKKGAHVDAISGDVMRYIPRSPEARKALAQLQRAEDLIKLITVCVDKAVEEIGCEDTKAHVRNYLRDSMMPRTCANYNYLNYNLGSFSAPDGAVLRQKLNVYDYVETTMRSELIEPLGFGWGYFPIDQASSCLDLTMK